MTPWARQVLFLLVIAIPVVSQDAAAQTPAATASPQNTTPQPADARPTGLPTGIKWTFNLDAGWGSFGFNNSLFINPKEPGTNEDLSDQWFEGFVKPALSGTHTLSTSEIYGKVSGVGERTYGSIPADFGEDISSFQVEDLSIGWRSGTSFSIAENAVDVTLGRTQYKLGHGFLLFDGAAEGGSRGGYWTNARKAFEFAAIGRFKAAPHTVETFYLDKDELSENDSGSRVWGLNYEFTTGEDDTTTLGATYMKWFAHEDQRPERDGLNVFNMRAYTAPFQELPELSFEFEYAYEKNGAALESNAWTFQGAYELSDVSWKPKFSYRYAFFQGDKPSTTENEAFDPLFLGFYDWGTWWQGEIGGEYFLSNSNLRSDLFRVHVAPTDQVGVGLLFFNFSLDQPEPAGTALTTAKDVAFEFDAYMDWKLNSAFTLSLVGAFADPKTAVEQVSGRTKDFSYGMAYVAYSF